MSDLKWSYMDHWVTDSPRGPVWPLHARSYMDRYIQQLAGLGFAGFDTFVYRLPAIAEMYGSIAAFAGFIRDCGLEKITGIFTAYPNATRFRAPHVRETHEQILADCRMGVQMCAGLGVENFIVMPTTTYYDVEPVTRDKLEATADLWNRVGEMTLAEGMKTTCHFEFWGAIRTAQELETFFQLTDPRYVFYFCDTAQHTIAGVDPVALFEKHHDRCTGFHFKDTRDVDTTGLYRTPPDPELMAPEVERWFWEMGRGQGLVDFPALMRSILARDWSGWLTVELDKADIGGGNYAESTCVAKWYIDFLAEAGGSVLVARPAPSQWQQPVARAGALDAVARCWEMVGTYARSRGVALALHVDFLSALRTDDNLDRLLDATDPALVGVALDTADTAELAVAGVDPVAFYRQHRDRIVHVQLKNARQVDSRGEYALPHAELNLLRGGGSYGEQRWFRDLDTPGGLVDVAGFLDELDASGYDGWRIVESDHSPHPAETAMHNSWFLRHVVGVGQSLMPCAGATWITGGPTRPGAR